MVEYYHSQPDEPCSDGGEDELQTTAPISGTLNVS